MIFNLANKKLTQKTVGITYSGAFTDNRTDGVGAVRLTTSGTLKVDADCTVTALIQAAGGGAAFSSGFGGMYRESSGGGGGGYGKSSKGGGSGSKNGTGYGSGGGGNGGAGAPGICVVTYTIEG